MAIQRPDSGYKLPQLKFSPLSVRSYMDNTLPEKRPVSAGGLSAAEGAVSVAEALKDLPTRILDTYHQGRLQASQERKLDFEDEKRAFLKGQMGEGLDGFSIQQDGVSYKPESQSERDLKAARVDTEKAHANYYRNRPTGPAIKTSLSDKYDTMGVPEDTDGPPIAPEAFEAEGQEEQTAGQDDDVAPLPPLSDFRIPQETIDQIGNPPTESLSAANVPGPTQTPPVPTGGLAEFGVDGSNLSSATKNDLRQSGAAAPERGAVTQDGKKNGVFKNSKQQAFVRYINGQAVEILPFGANSWRSLKQPPKAPAEKDAWTFDSVEEANKFAIDNGFALPELTKRGDKVIATSMKPSAETAKGTLKLTDSTRKELSSSVLLFNDMRNLVGEHDKLYNEGKVGPAVDFSRPTELGPLWQRIKKATGQGSADVVGADGKIAIGTWKIARLLNGPGVLTQNDIKAAQAVAPGINETPESFKAKMLTVLDTLESQIANWKQMNGAQAQAGQIEAADLALKSIAEEKANLGGKAAPAATGQPEASADKIQTIQKLIADGKDDERTLTPREIALLKMQLDRLTKKQ